MKSDFKVLYITNHSKETIQSKPDNFAYYVKSMMADSRIDLCLLSPMLFAKRSGILNTISILKEMKEKGLYK